jgi:hypothetical protein
MAHVAFAPIWRDRNFAQSLFAFAEKGSGVAAEILSFVVAALYERRRFLV